MFDVCVVVGQREVIHAILLEDESLAMHDGGDDGRGSSRDGDDGGGSGRRRVSSWRWLGSGGGMVVVLVVVSHAVIDRGGQGALSDGSIDGSLGQHFIL